MKMKRELCREVRLIRLPSDHRLIQGPVHPSFELVECKFGRVYPSNNWLWTGKTSAGSILDISKYRDTCERSISILGGIAILRYIEYRMNQ